MKRHILTLGGLLLCLMLRSQTTHMCRYWFDLDDGQAMTATFSGNNWQAQLDVGSLLDGLHSFHVQVAVADSAWGAPKNFLFFRSGNIGTDAGNMDNPTYIIWFDLDFEHYQSGPLGSGNLLLDADGLEDGLHALHVMLEGNSLTSARNYLFFKNGRVGTGAVNMSDPNYICWFDKNYSNAMTAPLGTGHFLLDTDDLEDGLHTLNVMLEGDVVSAPKCYFFIKEPSFAINSVDMSNPNYICWYDQDYASAMTAPLGTGHFLLDTDNLEDGLHTLNVMLEGNVLSAPQCYFFVKESTILIDPVDMSELEYICWFDLDYEHRQTGEFSGAPILLDADDVSPGLHTLHVMLEGSALTTTKTYMFMKVPPEDTYPIGDTQCRFWYDQDYSTLQTKPLDGGIFQLDASELTDGLHTLHVQLDNGRSTTPRNYMFMKMPEPKGDYGIAKWEYMINDDKEHRHVTELSPVTDDLVIISLLPVETWPVRSTCFHFHPNGEEPYLNPKNEISFRFYDVESRFLDRTAYYVDYNISESIEAELIERNTTVTIAAPNNNYIHWFKMPATAGDSLAFMADKACTLQLFAPSGEEVYSASSASSISFGGCHAWEDGTYFLAVHDASTNAENIEVSYQWINRYAVLSLSANTVGNGGWSTITLKGNGFDSLDNVYLTDGEHTIGSLDIGHESRISTTVTFDFYEAALGQYDLVAEFPDEIVTIGNALQVESPVDIYLTATASYPVSFMTGTSLTYSFSITNTGNMSAYGVPIYLYISTPALENITHLELEGISLPSVLDYLEVDWDTIANADVLRQLVYAMGDDHNFFKHHALDDNHVDELGIRSNFFFVNLEPYETKTIGLKMTAVSGPHEPLGAWMTVPEGLIYPHRTNNPPENDYCCVEEKISCTHSVITESLSMSSLLQNGLEISSCLNESFQHTNNVISRVVCENSDMDWFDAVRTLNKKSVVGKIIACEQEANAFNQLGDAVTLANGLANNLLLDELASFTSYPDCVSVWSRRKPNCPLGEPVGGVTDGRTPGDPNDITGYIAESGSRFMPQEIQNIHYEIEFENDTAIATAAAHTIIVRDTLNANHFDLSSLAANSVTIGEKVLPLNGEQNFVYTLDLRPEIQVIAQIEQTYDANTGIIEWVITSLNPMTLEPITDPNLGVLPVNYFGDGVGFIDYSVNLKQAFPDGSEISNRAGIIFDQEEIIMTPTWTNIVDAVKPVSYIESAEFVDDSLSFSFVSSDSRSGVWYHTLYYRNVSTELEWQIKKAQIFENDYMLKPDLMTTEFLVMAVDSAGNHEEKEMNAEYIYHYDGPEPIIQVNTFEQGWNWWSTYLDITLDDLKSALVATGNNAITIKSKDNGSTKYNGTTWNGQLTTLDVTKMYRISVSTACEITLEGTPINPAAHPITIHNGTNWIAFPFGESMTVNNAFAGFAVSGDVVKSKDNGIATYNGSQWRGTLNTLVPGQGYIYKSNASQSRTFTFPTSAK